MSVSEIYAELKCLKIKFTTNSEYIYTLSDIFFTQTGVKQQVALSPLFFKFSLEHTIIKVQGNQVEMKFNGTYQLLVHTDYNFLGISVP